MSDSTGPAAAADASGQGAKVTSAGPLLVVDVGKRQTRKRVRAMRKGRGKLFDKITDLVAELKSSGTIKGDVQPIVIVVRRKERRLLEW
jgi:hypothetical protein